MKVYLNAGFGEPLPQADFEQLKRLGFAGIRTDILDNGLADACAAEVKSAGVEAIFLVKSDQIHLAVDATRAHQLSGVVVEVENEPNYTAVSPETLAARINAAAAANPDIQFVSGGVAFWESDGRDYLRRMIAAGLADSVIIGFHAYRTTPATTPLPGFASRAAEFAQLRRIAPGRRYWHTEVGWHTARRCTLQIGPFCFRSEQLSDTQVRDYWADELQINQDNGVEVVVCYQLNDGPSTAAADRFGIRRLDGSEKPVAAVFAPYAPPAPQPIPTPTPRPGIFWIGTTDFRLPQLQMAGEHDRFKAIIDQRLACGFRLFRVLGMKFNNTGWELNPDGRPEFFTSDIPRFFDYMGSRNAQVEWNIYADTLHLPGWADPNKQMDFYFRSNDALRPYAAFTFVSLGNEVLHTGHQQLNGVSRFPKPEGLRFCRGSSLMDSPPVEPLGDYATYGVRRDALPDARGAGNYSPYGFRAVYPQPVPLIPTEGMKPENYGFDPGFARLIGLHARCGWGGIFHHGRGINGELFTAEEEACARAFVEGLAPTRTA